MIRRTVACLLLLVPLVASALEADDAVVGYVVHDHLFAQTDPCVRICRDITVDIVVAPVFYTDPETGEESYSWALFPCDEWPPPLEL